MLVTNLKKDFYDVICGKPVLVLAGCDVDAVCACKIFQCLFSVTTYSLIPVSDEDDLKQEFAEHAQYFEYVVLMNCGATIDVAEWLADDNSNIIFFIADSHRPLDVHNVYSSSQVRVLIDSEVDEDFPSYNDVFRDDSSDDGDSDNEQSEKRQRFDEEYFQKRRERRNWREKRDEVLYQHEKYSFYGYSTAALFYKLCWEMTRDNNELLWCGIVGFTEQFVNKKINMDQYQKYCNMFKSHVIRLNHNDSKNSSDHRNNSSSHDLDQRDGNHEISVDCMKISFNKDLALPLYRHWTVSDSMKHSIYIMCKFKLWKQKGENRLKEFWADLGLPLVQVEQKFRCMDLTLRENLKSLIEDKIDKYNLEDVVFDSFLLQFGYQTEFSATDVVYAVTGLLESAVKDKTFVDCFHDSLNSLSRTHLKLLINGIESSIQQLQALFDQVRMLTQTNQITKPGPFLSASIPEGTPLVRFLNHYGCLGQQTAQFMLQAKATEIHRCHVTHLQATIIYYNHLSVVNPEFSRAKDLPLLLSTPYVNDEGLNLLIGIPPLSIIMPKNFLGKAFEVASRKMTAHVRLGNFDSSVIQIAKEDQSKFIDMLTSILQ